MDSLQSACITRKWITSFFLLIMLAMATASAFAFIDTPVLIPSDPLAGETISVNIHYGYCDDFIVPPYPQITQVGNAIHLLLATLHFDDPLWCQSPPVSPRLFRLARSRRVTIPFMWNGFTTAQSRLPSTKLLPTSSSPLEDRHLPHFQLQVHSAACY